MSNVTSPIILDETGQAIVDAITQSGLVQDKITQINNAGDAKIQEIIETIVVDPTLSIEGAAADAKATGDAVNKLNSSITNKTENIVNLINGENLVVYSNYVQGSLGNNGVLVPNNMRISTRDFIDMSGIDEIHIIIADGYRIYLYWFDENKTYIVGRGWFTGELTRTVEFKYLKYTFATVGDAEAVTPASFDDSMLSITYEVESRIDAIEQRVSNIEEQISDNIPSYWTESLNSSISKVQNLEEITDAQGDSFVFITDTHWDKNAKVSPSLIKNILNRTNVKKIFFGGDVLTLYDTQAKALSNGRAFFDAFPKESVYSALGNHDVNNNQGTYGSEAYLSYQQVYSYMFKDIENNVSDLPKFSDTNGDVNRNFYYYLDNITQKMRYIVLNNARARIGLVQTNWLKAKLTQIQSGWTAIVFAHEYWFGLDGSTPVEVTYGKDIETAINEVYDSMNGTVAALIVGHCHYDYSKTSDKGYPIIATTTDAYRLSNTAISPSMTLGTTTEQAFDIYSIDTKNRKIYATRIGAGSDRSFDF